MSSTARTGDWARVWNDPALGVNERLMVALLLLNGLSPVEIQALAAGDIDRATGWIQVARGRYPLLEQTRSLLEHAAPAAGPLFAPGTVDILLTVQGLSPEDAHRKLAGALWITSDDTRLISSLTGAETPILPLQFTFPFSVIERLSDTLAPDLLDQSRTALQAAADWLERELLHAPAPLVRRVRAVLFQGKTIFMLASTGVNGINMLFNLVMGRLLSPAAYSQLALLVTLQLLIGLLPTALQTAVARFSAGYAANNRPAWVARLRREGLRLTGATGVVVTVLLLVGSPALAQVFQLDSPLLLVPLALGSAFFITMSVDRGVLQGIDGFYWLASAYLTEAAVRFIGSVGFGLVLVGAAARLQGGAWALGESMVATWFVSWLALRHFSRTDALQEDISLERRRWLGLSGLALTALVGQALITNSDFLLVKSMFSPQDSGLYAAVSILGRIVYFGTLPITIVLVPMIARKQALNEPTRRTFLLMLGGGAAFCGLLLVVSTLFAPLIVRLLYGDAYLDGAGLLPPYTLAASLFVIANLAITYRVALGLGNETVLPLIAGVLQVVGILLFHGTLLQVILVQVVLMALLLAAVLFRVLRDRA